MNGNLNLPLKLSNQLKVVWAWNGIASKPIFEKALEGKNTRKAISKLDNLLIEMDKAVTYYTQSIDRQKQRLKLASILGSFMNKSKILKKRVNPIGETKNVGSTND